MRGKHRARAINRDARAAESAATAIEKEHDRLREQIRLAESEAGDLADIARHIYQQLAELTHRDGPEATKVCAQAEELTSYARELAADVDWRRQQLRRVARRIRGNIFTRTTSEDVFTSSAVDSMKKLLDLHGGVGVHPHHALAKCFADRLGVGNDT
jgi:chromosome segregation ATPase